MTNDWKYREEKCRCMHNSLMTNDANILVLFIQRGSINVGLLNVIWSTHFETVVFNFFLR